MVIDFSEMRGYLPGSDHLQGPPVTPISSRFCQNKARGTPTHVQHTRHPFPVPPHPHRRPSLRLTRTQRRIFLLFSPPESQACGKPKRPPSEAIHLLVMGLGRPSLHPAF